MPMSSFLPCFRALLCAATLSALAATHARAQGASAFGELPISGGTTASALTQLGKIAVYDDGTALFAWSSHTRRWIGIPKSAQAILRQANDWLVVQDGTTWRAFSSMRGAWETKQLSSLASILNPASQRNDSILLVRDGNKIHSFSGFVGLWREQAIPATAQVVVQRHAAIAATDSTLWGFGAFDGVWRTQSIGATPSALFADSFGAVAEVGNTVYGYSAQSRSWASATLPGGTLARARAGDIAIWLGTPIALAWSALRGRFVTQLVGTGASQIQVNRQVAVIRRSASTLFFSSPLAAWTTSSIPGSAVLSLDATCAVLVEPTVVHGYSALTGSIATVNEAVSAPQVARAVGAVVGASGKPLLYSAIQSRWFAAPGNAKVGPATIAAHAALVDTTTGHAAWSSRTGRFTPLLSSGGAGISNPATSILGVLESTRLSIFDERSQRWLRRARLTAQNPSVWRTVLLGLDGATLVGYGSQSGRLEAQGVSTSVAPFTVTTSSELGTALHAHGVWAYSPLPELLTAAQYPEFRRIWTIGNTLPIYLAAPAQSAAIPFLGARAAVPIPTTFGELDIDLNALVVGVPLALSSIPSTSFEVAIPNDVALRGIELAWQALVLPRAPSVPYLTGSSSTLLR